MLRNLLFSTIFFSGIIFISLLFLPTLILPRSLVLSGGKLMGYWTSFCLRLILSVEIKVLGKENIIIDKKFFIAASHQSMFETFYLQTIFNSQVFILKKELLLIPIFGWYLKKIGSISIKRNKISKENLNFYDDILKLINSSDRPLIIFPQGTRLLAEDRSDFKKGVGRIYEELKIKCQPVAINSGKIWPKAGLKKANLNLTISILDPIDAGMDKELFLKNLQDKIYSELDELN